MKKNLQKHFIISLCLCFIFLFSDISVFADSNSAPSLPMSVSGSTKKPSGAFITSGTVQAILDGQIAGSVSINSDGSFGGTGLAPHLLVQGSYSANINHPVTFNVNGVLATASKTVNWVNGDFVTDVVLTAAVIDPSPNPSPSPSPSSDPGSGTGTGTGSGPSGPTPTPTATPTQTATPTPTPKPIGSPDVVGVDTSKNVVKSEKAADGQVTTTVTQDDKSLSDALTKAANQDNHGAAPIVSITFNNPVGEAVVFNLSSSTLATAAANAPTTVVSFKSNDGEYSLPLNVIDFSSIVQNLGTTTGNISIQVKIASVSTTVNNQIGTNAQNSGTTQIGNAIDFSITAVGNGKTVELNNFGSTYVERTVVMAVPVDDSHATVVLYDPATGLFSFVPAVFEKLADGTSKITFKRNGNSIYTVLSSTKTFTDVNQHWAKADIELLASKLVIIGTTETEFSPDSNITRAEFAALLVRSLGLTPNANLAAFKDVKSSDWFAGSIGAAVKAKLVSGFDDNSFKPNDTITREQMAVMVSRAISAAGKTVDIPSNQQEALAKFKDNSTISSWAQAAVAESVQAKIISGMTETTFVPSANASRAQAAVMLTRLLQFTNFIN